MNRKEIKRKHREFIDKIKSFEKRSKNISIVYSKSILDMCAIQINIKHYLRTPVAREMLDYIESICHYEDGHWYRNFNCDNEQNIECKYEASVCFG